MNSCSNCNKQNVCYVKSKVEVALSNGFAFLAKDEVFEAIANKCMEYEGNNNA